MDTPPLPAAGGRYERDPATGDLRRMADTPAEAMVGEFPDTTGSNADPDPAEADPPPATDMEG